MNFRASSRWQRKACSSASQPTHRRIQSVTRASPTDPLTLTYAVINSLIINTNHVVFTYEELAGSNMRLWALRELRSLNVLLTNMSTMCGSLHSHIH